MSCNVQVYDNKVTSRKEIIMDMDIVFASDLEVVFAVKAIKARVSDFSMRGMVRVVLKPLISEIPLIGGVQVLIINNIIIGIIKNIINIIVT